MKDYHYVSSIIAMGLKLRHTIMSHRGELVWGVCEESVECYVLHDGLGKAYEGIRLNHNEKMNINAIMPYYKGKAMLPSNIKFDELKGLKKVYPYQNGTPWGVCWLKDGSVVVFNVLKQVFDASMIHKGEGIDFPKILPSYKGVKLPAYPVYDMKVN